MSLKSNHLRYSNLLNNPIKAQKYLEANFQFFVEAHKQKINALALTFDSKYLASCSDTEIIIWNAENLRPISRLLGHTNIVACLSAIGSSYILSGSSDRTIRMWSLESMSEVLVIKAHSEGVTCLAINHYSNDFASGSQDGCIKLWNISSKAEKTCFSLNKSKLNSLVFTKNSEKLISANDDGRIVIWDINSQVIFHSFSQQSGENLKISLSSDSNYLVSSTFKGAEVSICNLKTLESKQFVLPNKMPLSKVLLVRDNKYVMYSTNLYKLVLYPLVPSLPILDLNVHEAIISDFAVDSEENTVFTVSFDRTVQKYSIEDRRSMVSQVHSMGVSCLKFDFDKKFVISGSRDKTIRVFDFQKNLQLHVLNIQNSSCIYITACRKNSTFLCYCSTGDLIIWNTQTSSSKTLPLTALPLFRSLSTTPSLTYLICTHSSGLYSLTYFLHLLPYNFS